MNKRPIWNEEYCSCSYIDECEYCKAFGELVQEIEKKERAKNIKPMCLICLKDLFYSHSLEDYSVLSPKLGDVKDGNDFVIYGGYSSRFDDMYVKAFICDDCYESRFRMSVIFEVERNANG